MISPGESSRRRNCNGSTRAADDPHTSDEVRSLAEKDGEEPDRLEARQEEKVKSPQPASAQALRHVACPTPTICQTRTCWPVRGVSE